MNENFELSDDQLNALADAGDNLLKERGLERLLNDILNTPPPKFHPGLRDEGWEGGNDEWPQYPTE